MAGIRIGKKNILTKEAEFFALQKKAHLKLKSEKVFTIEEARTYSKKNKEMGSRKIINQ